MHFTVTHKLFPSPWPKCLRLKQAATGADLNEEVAEPVAAFDSPDCWGSAEEHEIQRLLQELVSSTLNLEACQQVLHRIYGCIITSSDGWIDRFAEYQGTLVLTKLLSDINAGDEYMQRQDRNEYESGYLERELAIVNCVRVIISRSSIARRMACQDKSQSVVHALLRSAISPHEQTRQFARLALEELRLLIDFPSSDILQMLHVHRSPFGGTDACVEESYSDTLSCASFKSV